MEQYVAILKLDPVTWLVLLWLVREVHSFKTDLKLLETRARSTEDRTLVLEKSISGIRRAQ